MASYGGLPIFGVAVTFSTVDSPRSTQTNTFFGVDGVETLDGGFRGRVTTVRGVLVGPSAGLLATAEGTMRTYNDGQARVLIDNQGTAWSDVVLKYFAPIGRVRQSSDGACFRPYLARFFHLT